jgi:hypothetical protein
MKYVLVTGGVVSGLGKGVTASSIGVLLKACGHRVTAIKIDPYLNVDAGTMSPFEHGEVFVLDDGGEVGKRSTLLPFQAGGTTCRSTTHHSLTHSCPAFQPHRPIWTWATMSASWTSPSPKITISPLARSTK